MISNHFLWWILLTSAMREGRSQVSFPCTPRRQLLISFSSPFWYRLETHPELHSYRPSSAGTGVGCLLFCCLSFDGQNRFCVSGRPFSDFRPPPVPLTKVAWSRLLILMQVLSTWNRIIWFLPGFVKNVGSTFILAFKFLFYILIVSFFGGGSFLVLAPISKFFMFLWILGAFCSFNIFFLIFVFFAYFYIW